jgi:hypothetical protein
MVVLKTNESGTGSAPRKESKYEFTSDIIEQLGVGRTTFYRRSPRSESINCAVSRSHKQPESYGGFGTFMGKNPTSQAPP